MVDAQRDGAILAVIRAIPHGCVASYGQVALRAGLPGRARMVAQVLGRNEDAKLPWHRVLRSDGSIAMPEGSAGAIEQAQRLRSEGHDVQGRRVRGARVSAVQSLDEAIWGAPPEPRARGDGRRR